MVNSKKTTVMVALFAAFISAGCFIQIPLPGGVPIVIQDMMAMLSGLLLGPLWGGLSVLVFLILGCFGIPVFSGKAGIQVILAAPTGGFLIGYLFAAIAGGLVLKFAYHDKKNKENKEDKEDKNELKSKLLEYFWILLACLTATIVVFALGILGFIRVTDSPFMKSLAVVLIPFIPGNIIKIVVMIPLVKKFRPILHNYLG